MTREEQAIRSAERRAYNDGLRAAAKRCDARVGMVSGDSAEELRDMARELRALAEVAK